MSLGQIFPWWFKISAKICLSRLPVPYSFWKKCSFFEHGQMNDPQKAFDIFISHAMAAGVISSVNQQEIDNASLGGMTVLEIGPGDSLFSMQIAKALGASGSWLVDAGDFATKDLALYEKMNEYLEKKLSVSIPVQALSIEQLSENCGGRYLTQGVESLRLIPDQSIDYCFSNAVLEHIPKNEFTLLLSEFHRILKSDGVCFHRVDLKDHLGGGLNNLRFKEPVWEGKLFRSSGFYTNRIRFREMLSLFEDQRFEYGLSRVDSWDKLPINRSSLAPVFNKMTDEDLLVRGFDVILRRKG